MENHTVTVEMHPSLFKHVVEGLIALTKNQVRHTDLPRFFWEHLQCDVTVLARAVGKSGDDACLLLHLVLKQVALSNPPQGH